MAGMSASPDSPSTDIPDADATTGAGRSESAASMVTEILSAAPRAPVVETTEPEKTMLAEDVTIMAKGRRRRFRLR
jgi:hypothetical protein